MNDAGTCDNTFNDPLKLTVDICEATTDNAKYIYFILRGPPSQEDAGEVEWIK